MSAYSGSFSGSFSGSYIGNGSQLTGVDYYTLSQIPRTITSFELNSIVANSNLRNTFTSSIKTTLNAEGVISSSAQISASAAASGFGTAGGGSGGAAFPFVGEAVITGSLTLSGDLEADNFSTNGITSVGTQAGDNNSGDLITVLGYQSGKNNTGRQLVSVGYQSATDNSADYASVLGYRAGYLNSGIYLSSVGYSAGRQNTGANQSSLGYTAGYINTGDNLTAIGYQAGRQNSGDNLVAIGHQAGYLNTLNNQFIVQHTAANAIPLIQGNFESGSVGIGHSPEYKFDVSGSARITDTLTVNATVYASQADLKEEIVGITKTKAKVIEFKEYQFKSGGGGRKRYGVLADDIEDDYPELVYTGPDGVKGVNYIDLLVKRVAELEKELADVSGSVRNHLSNVTSIAINKNSRLLEIVIDGNTYNLTLSK
jgi:hypothetical protein